MKINQDLTILEKLESVYALFDQIVSAYCLEKGQTSSGDTLSPETGISGLDSETDISLLVCKKKCAACCTCNVTVTRLEARYMIQGLSENKQNQLLKKIKVRFPEKRYIPKMTFNRFARLCMEGRSIPDEENDPAWGRCSLLETDLCSLYYTRPFGCRALLSSLDCQQSGFAQLPPFLLTVANLFLQYIEQMDQGGFSGNLSDMLLLFLSKDQDTDDASKILMQKNDCFVSNESVSVLMVPPEHQVRIRPVIEKLNGILGQ